MVVVSRVVSRQYEGSSVKAVCMRVFLFFGGLKTAILRRWRGNGGFWDSSASDDCFLRRQRGDVC